MDAAHHVALAPGSRIEEYRILSVLGEGSFGITYLAEDVNLGARLAIKEYLPSDWAFRDSTQTVRPKSTHLRGTFELGQDAFLNEARLLARVSHPNVVKVRRYFRGHGTAYIAMDFIEGRNLSDTLVERYATGGYPSGALKQLLVALLNGLGALHDAGIIHRDIKPANVVIQPNGNPVLVDFGSARNVDRQGMTVIVTHGYAPIEQYSDDGEQGPFTDLYALGALAYRAIAGQPPEAPYRRLGRDTALMASVVGAGRYPQELLSAIDWALAVRPEDRPANAAALLALLRDVPEGERTVRGPIPAAGEPTIIMEATRWQGRSQKNRRVSSEASIAVSGDVEATGNLGAPGGSRSLPAPSPRGRRAAVIPITIALCAIAVILACGYVVAPALLDGSLSTVSSEDQERLRAAEAERRAAAAKQKADHEAAEAAEAERQAAEAAKLKAEQEAAAAAEAQRRAAEEAALKSKQDAAAEAAHAAPKAASDTATARAAVAPGVKTSQAAPAARKPKVDTAEKHGAPSHAADPRCTSILQTAQLNGELSDEDRAYLEGHCH